MSSLFAQLFCCCVRPRADPIDAESTVIPNEHSRLLDPPSSPAIVVDHQKLSDRLGTIVRAKEGKMVSVSARTPFTLHDAEQLPSASTANRRPPILTMTPARSQGSLNLHSNSNSRSPHSSRSGSRASSRQPELRSHSAHSTSPAPPSATCAPLSESASGDSSKPPVDASEWFAESESDLSVEDEVRPSDDNTPKVPAATPLADPQGIAFDWDA
ncbi:hypothetical protein B0H16DRAFT_1588898 [Mycena metata]|uniref:Uncharacterized protein n=1 Tax=Mycena metata TaxID=1033252 RepID=A0AAD7MQQ1_9AGAR|nr:hypothetical protein B0H16DRAFT_1588898 [Mycena metata]